ncbi:hypothetical protein O3P69_014973 [Scylla paramamosain]|uniref:Uncharacterized protein n=1 Tax=Scylla paramamosain TaxID=85552 RepID=A0AAW0SHE7_SCYPA
MAVPRGCQPARLCRGGQPQCVFEAESWLASLPRDFILRLVTVYKNMVVQILNSAHQSSSERDRRALVSSLRLLSLVHGLNFQAGCRVGRLNYDDFYIPEIAEKIDIRNDYLNWMNSRLHPMSRREVGVCVWGCGGV